MRSILPILCAVLITGCVAAPPPQTVTVPFDPAEVAWHKVPGKNTVEGSAVLRTRGGLIRTCAGDYAELIPYSRYASERIRAIYQNEERGFWDMSIEGQIVSGRPGVRVADDQYTPAYKANTLRANCDAQGAFVFNNVPDGTYFLLTRVLWEVQGPQGGALMQKVEVRGGETKKIVLTQ